jgi:IS5 family transposase
MGSHGRRDVRLIDTPCFGRKVNLVRPDDEVVYGDAGYQGAQKRPEFTGEGHLSGGDVAGRCPQGQVEDDASPDRAEEPRKASVRAKVEHP